MAIHLDGWMAFRSRNLDGDTDDIVGSISHHPRVRQRIPCGPCGPSGWLDGESSRGSITLPATSLPMSAVEEDEGKRSSPKIARRPDRWRGGRAAGASQQPAGPDSGEQKVKHYPQSLSGLFVMDAP